MSKARWSSIILIGVMLLSKQAYLQTPQTIESLRVPIRFLSNGVAVNGYLYTPRNYSGGRLPAVVMAPGFSGTVECNYQFIADHFCREGLAVLLFDYPNFGRSEGAVRGEINPWQQIEAYRNGISFLCTRPEVDTNRIGVWGGSYSGGHALVVAALDSRVKCMVVLTPFVSGTYFRKAMPEQQRSYLLSLFHADRTARLEGKEPVMIPVASKDPGEFCAIPSPHAMDFIESFSDYAPTYVNAVTLSSLEMQLEYNPGMLAAEIPSIPKLFIIARQDEIMPEEQILETYQRASEPKQLTYIDGTHFSPYMEMLDTVSDITARWLKDHLR